MEIVRGRIVVGVDGSTGSRAALVHALADAARRRAGVEVVAAFHQPEYWVPPYARPVISIDEIREDVRRDAERMVQQVTAELTGHLAEMPPVTVHVVAGRAASALLRAAAGAELLVVGSRGHGAIGGMLLGSVSLACALGAPCPVTVVHGARRMKPEEPAFQDSAPAVS